MKKVYPCCSLCLLLLLLSCHRDLKDNPISEKQIAGTYDLWDTKEKLTLNADFTYKHVYANKDDLICEVGTWEYFRVIGRNEVVVYDITSLSNGEYRKLNRRHFIACKIWGNINLTLGYEGDPDGAPALKWYKKIE